MHGRPALKAPISRPGVVLSQPPISTAPSTGWLRSSSSTFTARKLRYSMVVGLTMGSDIEIAGNSIGKPPRLQHAALHVFDALLEVGVAWDHVRPGVQDGAHRLVRPVGRRIAHLHEARAVRRRAQVVRREPAGAAQASAWAAHGRARSYLLTRTSRPGGLRVLRRFLRHLQSPRCNKCISNCVRLCLRLNAQAHLVLIADYWETTPLV